MNLIIFAPLSEPPTELVVFRDLTLFADTFLHFNVLIDAPQDEKDLYYFWLKKHGCYDFVRAILRTDEKENGISLSSIENRPKRIKTDRITCNNLRVLLSKIANFSS